MNNAIGHAENAMMTPVTNGRDQDFRSLRGRGASSHANPPARGFRALFAWLVDALHRRRTIAELQSLSDRDLADIGLNRAEIASVFNRPTVAASTARPARIMRPANDLAGVGRATA